VALTIIHQKVSHKPDRADSSVIRPSDWNAPHAVQGTLGPDQLDGDYEWTGNHTFGADLDVLGDLNFIGQILNNGVPFSGSGGAYAVPNTPDPSSPVFDCQRGDVQLFTTNGDITNPSFVNMTVGQRVTVIITVDPDGPRSVTWPDNVSGGMELGTLAGKRNVQTFVSPDGLSLIADTYGVQDLD
jgi:hypothetical protein